MSIRYQVFTQLETEMENMAHDVRNSGWWCEKVATRKLLQPSSWLAVQLMYNLTHYAINNDSKIIAVKSVTARI